MECRTSWYAALLLCALACCSELVCASPEQALIDWVISLGGTVKAEIKVNEAGIRGLFVLEDIEQFKDIVTIPAAAIINNGGMTEFSLPTLNLMRELHAECSRYQPYLATMPAKDRVLNGCNMPNSYLPMLQIKHWQDRIHDWKHALKAIITGEMSSHSSLILQEVVGAKNVTLEDMEYACALSATRYITADPRPVLVMVPIFDMVNHVHGCPHYIRAYEDAAAPGFSLQAGAPIKKGEEVCYTYGDLRDDYCLVHYGFLPDVEDPPRLCLVDHPAFNTSSEGVLPYEVFEGTLSEMAAELGRLHRILTDLTLLDNQATKPPRLPGGDYAYDLLIELQARRRTALRHEMGRIKGILATRAAVEL